MCSLAWLFEMERRSGESFLCLLSVTLLPLASPSKPIFWFWPWSSRGASLSLRPPRRRLPEPRFSIGSRLCFSTGHSWLPFTQAQSTLYLLYVIRRRQRDTKPGRGVREMTIKLSCLLLWFCMLPAKFTLYNSPAAIVEIETNGDLCPLGDGPQ